MPKEVHPPGIGGEELLFLNDDNGRRPIGTGDNPHIEADYHDTQGQAPGQSVVHGEGMGNAIEAATGSRHYADGNTAAPTSRAAEDDVKRLLHELESVTRDENKSADDKKIQAIRMIGAVLEKYRAGYEKKANFAHGPVRLRDVNPNTPIAAIHQMKSEDELVNKWQRTADTCYLVHSWLRTMDQFRGTGYMAKGGMQQLDIYQQQFKPLTQQLKSATRATTNPLNTGTASEGGDWIPTGFSAELWEFYRLKLAVAGLFREDIMQTNPWKKPIITDRPKARISSETTGKPSSIYAGATMSNFATAARTYNAIRFYTWMSATGLIQAEAVLNMMDEIREQIALAMRDAREDGCLNGDTAGTHMDSDITASDDIRKAWLGLRGFAKDMGGNGITTVAAADSVSAFDAARKKMGKWGVNPRDLVYIVSMTGYIDLINDDKVTSIEKYGPAATIVTGELAKVRGVPVVVSEFMREDLNVAGVYDGTTTDNTASLLVNTTQVRWGRWGAMTLEPFRDPFNNLDSLISAEEADFVYREDASSTSTFVHLNADVTAA